MILGASVHELDDTAWRRVPGLLSRERTVAGNGFSRWMVPPAALCVHLCIGQAYAFSVFNLPMTRLIGITQSAPDDWKLTDLGWIFSIAIFVLGASAALLGRWVEEGGPRRAMFTAGLCWAGGFLLSAVGVYVHNIWLVYLGYGVLGGFGLGIGYISPVSTLIKWFPDRPGMATGMAIMGFGGGAFIASPLSVWLMRQFSTSTHVGVAETFIVLGVVYFCFMMVGAAIVRLPPPGWAPEGYVGADAVEQADHHAPRVRLSGAEDAAVLADLVGAVPQRHRGHRRARSGIGDEPGDVPGQGHSHGGGRLRRTDEPVQHGRPFLLGLGVGFHRPQEHLFRVLRARVPAVCGGAVHREPPATSALFVLCFCVIISMYGGGFATVPAYLRDMFGTRYVGAIHGMLLTAWSMAGIFGPVLVNYIRQYNVEHGVAKAAAYNVTMYVMAVLLIVGFFCNLFIRAVDERHHMEHEEADAMGMAD